MVGGLLDLIPDILIIISTFGLYKICKLYVATYNTDSDCRLFHGCASTLQAPVSGNPSEAEKSL